MAEQTQKKSIFSRIGKFFTDQKGEMKKVVWPSRKQVINNTIIVLVAVGIFALVTGLFDWGVGILIRSLIGA